MSLRWPTNLPYLPTYTPTNQPNNQPTNQSCYNFVCINWFCHISFICTKIYQLLALFINELFKKSSQILRQLVTSLCLVTQLCCPPCHSVLSPSTHLCFSHFFFGCAKYDTQTTIMTYWTAGLQLIFFWHFQWCNIKLLCAGNSWRENCRSHIFVDIKLHIACFGKNRRREQLVPKLWRAFILPSIHIETA